MLDLATVKNFLRVEHDEDDELIKIYMDTADEYIKSACGENVDMETAKARTLTLMLVSDYYETRSPNGAAQYSHNVQSMITQLRLETEGKDEETGVSA